MSKLRHSKGKCCLLYYDTPSAFFNKTQGPYVIMIFRTPTLLNIPSVYIFECLHYSYTKTAYVIYDTKSAYFIMISVKRYYNSIGKYAYLFMVSGLPILLIYPDLI